MTPMLRTIIADDEPLARQALRRFLNADADVSVVTEVEDLPTLRAALAREVPDLLFLDITMPGGSGLDVLPDVSPQTAIVFTTAHAEHAATAFAVDAVDYLVKPFGHDRVRDALARVRRRIAEHAQSRTPAALHVIIVRLGQALHPIPVTTIWRCEGSDDFVRLVTAQKSWLHGTTLAALEAQLDAQKFVRVHRSHIVNLEHVRRIVPADDRRLSAVFADGSTIACSRAGSRALRERFRLPASA
jgi:two-component system, LytTR family, response regulator